MKHFFATLILLGLVNHVLGQNSIAMETSKTNQKATLDFTKTKIDGVRHSDFLLAFNVTELPKIIHKMHMEVAQFNLKDLKLYTPGEKASYKVLFNEGKCKIEASYNDEGELTQSEESYENVRIPYSVSSKLAKDYPGWAFNNTLCKITYNQSGLPKITYHITMDKDGKKKTVKVNI
ncbi:MAG TPA: hypothetical protein VGA80_03290 [Flavobacteriaceae bacterium]|jgi:hypothetical protein